MKTRGECQSLPHRSDQGYLGDGGPATSAELWYPGDLAIDGSGNLYIAAVPGCCGIVVRMVSLANGIITTVAGGGLEIPGSPQGSIAVTQTGPRIPPLRDIKPEYLEAGRFAGHGDGYIARRGYAIHLNL